MPPQPLPAGKEGETTSVLVNRPRRAQSLSRLSGHLVGSPVSVAQLDVLLVLDPVQVLVQAVQQEGEQLLAVVLLVAEKLRRKMPHLRLQRQTDRQDVF